jgi:hypothetical protein
MLIPFSYNKVTYIKQAQRLFKIAEPAMTATLFRAVFPALQTQVRAL